jgi:diadenylate cyclase
MTTFQESFNNIVMQISSMELTDFLDIFVVALLLYKLLPLFRSTGSLRIARAIIVVFVVTWLTELLHMYTINFLLEQVLTVGLIAIVVLFQPELRRMLDHVTNIKVKEMLGMQHRTQEMAQVIAQTVSACEVMSRDRVGALIVFARDNRLEEYFKTGTMLDAQVSDQLIRNVFFPKASLHDGAMIIRDGRVTAAGCVLPLSESKHLHADLGTRHRAAIGLSEISDSVVIVVSEETGVISVAYQSELTRDYSFQSLHTFLTKTLVSPESQELGE